MQHACYFYGEVWQTGLSHSLRAHCCYGHGVLSVVLLTESRVNKEISGSNWCVDGIGIACHWESVSGVHVSVNGAVLYGCGLGSGESVLH